MNQQIGKVIEVFIPKENNSDIMNSKKIGFKIQLENDEVTVIEEQDEYNCKILRNDLVTVTKQIVSEKEFISIELYEGVWYE